MTGRARWIAGGMYAVAQRAWPSDLRRRHGADMRETFAALCDDAAARGMAAVIVLAVREALDVACAGVAARLRTRQPRQISTRRGPVGAFRQDVHYAWRMLRRQPGFALVAILTLSLGIGANTAVFTVVNGVLLKPLPYGDPQRLVVLLWGRPGRMSPWLSPPNYLDFAADRVLAESAAVSPATVNLTGLGEPERLEGAMVSWNFFHVLAVTMPHGRTFIEDDSRTPKASVAVLSDGLWKRRFGGRDDVVGSIIRLDGEPVTIVGVAPADTRFPGSAQLWLPLIFKPSDVTPNARGAQWINVIARLAPGVDLQQANTALGAVAARLAADYPRTNEGSTASLRVLQQQMVRNIRTPLMILLGAVTFVLLIACVNVANLLLARAQVRVREVAVRAALGAGRRRLVQQFLSESVLLGLFGALGGLAVAYWTTRALVALGPSGIPRLAEVGIDVRALAFTMAVAVGTSVLFGLAPALAATSGGGFLNAGGRSVGASGTRTRKTLVVCELALAVVLLVGAGLLIRSYGRLQQVSPGFDPEGVITFSLSLPEAKYPELSSVQTFGTTLLERIEAQPRVQSAAIVFGIPFGDDFSASTSFRRNNEPDTADSPHAGMRVVSPGYFKTMKIPLKLGRLLDARDDAGSPGVILVNEVAAQRYWPGKNPVGEQVRIGVNLTRAKQNHDKVVVGVVGNVKYGGLDEDTPPEIYLPHAQHQVDGFTVAVRTDGDPLAALPAIRHEVTSLDADLPLADVKPMTELIGASTAQRRFTTLLLATFAIVAVILAGIGIYGVLAYVVSQRTREIGVRLAVGASPRDVVRLIVREGALLSIVGLAAGGIGAVAATRVLASLLFGVTSTDPATFVAVAIGLAAIALAASYVPARRAARVDPMLALRTD